MVLSAPETRANPMIVEAVLTHIQEHELYLAPPVQVGPDGRPIPAEQPPVMPGADAPNADQPMNPMDPASQEASQVQQPSQPHQPKNPLTESNNGV